MTGTDRFKVIVLGSVDGTDVGEVYSGFRMVEALSRHADVTLLGFEREGRVPLAEQLPNAKVVTWREPPFLLKWERFNAMAKPAWPLLCHHVRQWMRADKARGVSYAAAHQLLPQGMRNTCPFQGQGIPYIIGPLGGGLTSPHAFAGEVGSQGMLPKLRAIDTFRLKHDFRLRRSYQGADIVLGVAPYVRERLENVGIKRFELFAERGFDNYDAPQRDPLQPGKLRLLHVGRTIRTKGLRDTIRALAKMEDRTGITLTVAGDGPDLANSKAEAARLGVSDIVTFLGKVSRQTVDELYATHDLFVFPSFQEPMGGVLFEALQWRLPIITVNVGGPGFIVTDTCGVLHAVETPEQLAQDLAETLTALAAEPSRIEHLRGGIEARMREIGTWDEKAAHLCALYGEIARPV